MPLKPCPLKHAGCYGDDRKPEAVKNQVLRRHFEGVAALPAPTVSLSSTVTAALISQRRFAPAFWVNPRHAPRRRHDLGI